MPILYNFCDKQTNTAQLVRCVKDHVQKLQKADFFIVATVCDQGLTNQAAIKDLLFSSNRKRNLENRTERMLLHDLFIHLKR